MIHAGKFVIKAREGEPITIKGLGDIHHLLKDSDEERFINDLRDRATEKTYFIDLGDNLDSIGPSHKYFSLGRVKPRFLDGSNGTEIDPILNNEVKDLASIISTHTSPSEWIGHVSGNHPLMILGTGVDMCQILCYELKHRYLGYQAYVPIEIVTNGKYHSLMLFVCHGFGGAGARWEGSGLNAYIQHSSRYEEWDIAFYGHRHDKWVKPLARIRPHTDSKGNRWIKEDVKLICQTGTYLRTLSDSMYPSYSEKKGMGPRPLGCVSIQFKVQREKGVGPLTLKYLNI